MGGVARQRFLVSGAREAGGGYNFLNGRKADFFAKWENVRRMAQRVELALDANTMTKLIQESTES